MTRRTNRDAWEITKWGRYAYSREKQKRGEWDGKMTWKKGKKRERNLIWGRRKAYYRIGFYRPVSEKQYEARKANKTKEIKIQEKRKAGVWSWAPRGRRRTWRRWNVSAERDLCHSDLKTQLGKSAPPANFWLSHCAALDLLFFFCFHYAYHIHSYYYVGPRYTTLPHGSL